MTSPEQPPQIPATTGKPTPDSGQPPPPRLEALAAAVRELESVVAKQGWDGPIRMFALVRTQQALKDPQFASLLPAETIEAAQHDPRHVVSIEQGGLPAADNLEAVLAQVGWPETVDGAVLVVERLLIPPEAEKAMPTDPEQALQYCLNHPERQDVRIAVGVLRDGSSWSVIRTKAFDRDDAVGGGEDLVPGLTTALKATFAS